MECARLIIGSVTGNHMMFVGGLDSAAPFSGRGTPLYPGLEGEREIFIENANRVRVCASFSGELIYYMGYINGQPTTISATTQGQQPNNQPPVLVVTNPLDKQENVPFRGSGIQFISTFDENIASGTVDTSSYSVHLSGQVAQDAFLSGLVAYYQPDDADDRTQIMFTPFSGQLIGSSWYNVYIGKRISDDFGSNIVATLTWSFLTAGIDDSPMVLKSFSPISGTTLAPFSQPIEATFSKQISGTITATGYTNCIFLWNDNIPNQGISGVTKLDDATSGKKLIFTPIALLQPGTLYRYTISGVFDQFDNTHIPLSGIAFSTGPADITGPIISGVTPSGYPNHSGLIVHPSVSGNVSTLTNITVTFDERISGIPGGIISGQVISVVNSGILGTNLSGIITLDQSGRVLTFDPVAELISGTAYQIRISGVRDVNGNVITQTEPTRSGIAFRTWVEADVTPPIIQSITPASGTVGNAVNSNIVATFNETLSGTHPDANFTAIIAVNLSGTGDVAGTLSTNSSGTVVTFNPTADLSGDRNYYVSVSGAQDLALNRMAPISGHVFTTIDNIAPLVSGIVPISGQTDFALNSNIVVTMSEAISGTAGGLLTPSSGIRLYKSGVVGSPLAGTITLDSASGRRVLTFNPTADLEQSEHYQVSVSGLRDVSGNIMTTQVSGHSFSTQAGPNITATSPTSGEIDVALGANMIVTFNKTLSGVSPPGTYAANVIKLWVSSATPSFLGGTHTINSDRTQITFNPTSDLISNTMYQMAVTGVLDLSGLFISQTSPPRSGFAFTSLTIDTTPPTFTTTIPASGTTGVLVNTTYVVNFSETISGTIGQGVSGIAIKVAISGHSFVTSGVSGVITKTAAAQLTFTPSADLSGDRWYRASITGVYDLASNQIVQPTATNISFRTVDNIPPVLSGISPTSGLTNVLITDNIIATFGETCSGNPAGGSVTNQVISIIKSGDPGTLIGGSLTIDATRKIFTFNPTNSLEFNKIYLVSVSGVRDLADNFMVPVSGHAFTTQGVPLTTFYDFPGATERPFGTVSPVILRAGEKRDATGSDMNGRVIKRAWFALKRTGTPGGTVFCRIRQNAPPDNAGSPTPDAIVTTFDNSYNVNTDISTTKTRYSFEKLTNSYALTTNDIITVEIVGATQNGSNYISVYYDDSNPYDGADSKYQSYDTGWDDFAGARDIDGKFEV